MSAHVFSFGRDTAAGVDAYATLTLQTRETHVSLRCPDGVDIDEWAKAVKALAKVVNMNQACVNGRLDGRSFGRIIDLGYARENPNACFDFIEQQAWEYYRVSEVKDSYDWGSYRLEFVREANRTLQDRLAG